MSAQIDTEKYRERLQDERQRVLDALGDDDVVIPYRAEAWWCRRDP